MKIIVGLGNPGIQYEKTRHNAGFLFLDFLHQQLNFPNFVDTKKFQAQTTKVGDLILVKPQTFMNLSGESVLKLVNFYKIDPVQDLIVAFDDLDLSLGQFKIQKAVGPKTHNGLASIYSLLNTQNFLHLRLGTDNRGEQRHLIPPIDYVLQSFPSSELLILQKTFPDIEAQLQSYL